MRPRLRLPALLALLLTLSLAAPSVQAQDQNPLPTPAMDSPLDIPYTKYVLQNGLTLIVHEDRKAPIVAVNVWYHVGSKNEPAGSSGFAHLFEHLMFNGSENANDDYFQAMERVGATDLNGTTNTDRTNYFQNVPTNALDLALFVESDRMGHLLGAIDQEKLDEQRGVVQNEKRQGENQPYGQVYNIVTENTWPEGHPYAHTVIGSMDDLNAASLDDVYEWFETYYGAANATVVVSGDISPEDAKARVERYFGDVQPGPPVAVHDTWIAKRSGEQRMSMQDRVPQARVHMVWNVPEWGSSAATDLDIASDVLAGGKTSRLYKRLVYDDQIATDVSAFIDASEIAGQFWVRATAKPGQDLAEVEAVVREELDRFLAEGPTEQELRRVQTQQLASFVRGAERIGGFGGKSDILAENEVYGGSPDYYKTTLAQLQSATPQQVHQTAREWLSDGVFVLSVTPFPEYSATASTVDRSAGLPEVTAPPNATFPSVQTATLSNGLEVMLVERDAVPVVNMRLIIDAGSAADQFALPGTASMTATMMDEGTTSRSALEISEELAMLGASLGVSSDLDAAFVTMSALTDNLDASLDLFADVALNPAFPEADFERLQRQRIAQIQREKVTPVQMALRVFPKLMYGDDHAYSAPFTGSGTEATTMALTTDALRQFHDTWFKPNNATLLVVGDASLGELLPKLEAEFGSWRRGDVPTKNIGTVAVNPNPEVYIMDRPGSAQTIIFAGHIAPPKANDNEIAIETMNTVLGGAFTSRINMNLREDKGWAYGAFSLMFDSKGQRPFLVYAPVQTDKTSESMAEIQAELNRYLGDTPPTADEVDKAQRDQTLSLAGRWETNGAVLGDLTELVQYGLPMGYWDTYTDQVRSLDVASVSAAAAEVLRPQNMTWVIVGDRSVIEPGIRSLGYGAIKVLDADGNVIE